MSSSANKLSLLNFYSLACAMLLYVGETVVAITDAAKPFSLSVDDYIVATGLFVFSLRPFTSKRLAGLAASWAFAVGGLWVMLIYRLPPLGEGERLGLLVGALLAAVVGLISTAKKLID